MADSQDKYSRSRAQGSRRAHASTQPASPKPERSPRKHQPSLRKHHSPKKRKKRERLPASLRFTETKRGKTTIRRYSHRTFHTMEEFRGKIIDHVQIYTSGEYSSISVRFQDKTSVDFVIDPSFTVDTNYADWKTGDMRRIKRWPVIHSEGRAG